MAYLIILASVLYIVFLGCHENSTNNLLAPDGCNRCNRGILLLLCNNPCDVGKLSRMASKLARKWMASIGQPIARVHTSLELANFSAGHGNGRYSMPYQIIRMRDATGNSKATVGHAKTLASARHYANRIMDGHGIENERSSYTYYIRDIRNGDVYRIGG